MVNNLLAAGVQYPNLMKIDSDIASVRNAQMQNELARFDMLAKQAEGNRQNRLAGYAEDYTATGNQNAFNRLAALDPKRASDIKSAQTAQMNFTEEQRNNARNNVARYAVGIMNETPDMQARAYQYTLNYARQNGLDTTGWPEQWNDEAAMKLRMALSQTADPEKVATAKAMVQPEADKARAIAEATLPVKAEEMRMAETARAPQIVRTDDGVFALRGDRMTRLGNNPTTPSETERLLAAAGLQPGTPEYTEAARNILDRRGMPPSTTVNVDTRGEQAFATNLGKNDADYVTNLIAQGDVAFRTKAEIDRIRAALNSERFVTGFAGEGRAQLARLAELAGIETGGIIGDSATADTIDAASKNIGAEIAKGLSRVTNMSLGLIRDALPNLSRSPEGNRILAEVMDRLATRDIAVADLTDRFLRDNNTLRPSEGPSLRELIREYDNANPVVDDALRERIMAGSKTAPRSWNDVLAGKTTRIPSMTLDELKALDPSTLTPEQRAEAARRWQELNR